MSDTAYGGLDPALKRLSVRGGDARRHDDDARHDDRQRRHPHPGARLPRLRGDDPVGRTGYLLALAMVIPLTGWAVERFGARTLWFALAGPVHRRLGAQRRRLVGGIADRLSRPPGRRRRDDDAGRPDDARPRRRALAHGPRHERVAVPALLGPVLGPVIGGAIIDGLSWRWIFYVNVPVGIVALLAAWRWLGPDANERGPRPDRRPRHRSALARTGRVRLRPLRGRQRRLRRPAACSSAHAAARADRRLRRPRPAHPPSAARHAPVRRPRLRRLGGRRRSSPRRCSRPCSCSRSTSRRSAAPARSTPAC